ncbi:DUF1540 domain-containing protein [Plantactinospora sp. GCM10030261]|uniref:DUF1540 domain-containing protein n=1 Tax=Plantactinospora sp. GCM10030261 TaxID=3273420 RepID=UPI003614DCC9
MATIDMPQVRDCAVRACAYNQTGCHAFAITVGSSERAHCETFVDGPVKGGVATLTAQVGACKRADCRHNDDLVCHASSITVGPDLDAADCLTYEPVKL